VVRNYIKEISILYKGTELWLFGGYRSSHDLLFFLLSFHPTMPPRSARRTTVKTCAAKKPNCEDVDSVKCGAASENTSKWCRNHGMVCEKSTLVRLTDHIVSLSNAGDSTKHINSVYLRLRRFPKIASVKMRTKSRRVRHLVVSASGTRAYRRSAVYWYGMYERLIREGIIPFENSDASKPILTSRNIFLGERCKILSGVVLGLTLVHTNRNDLV